MTKYLSLAALAILTGATISALPTQPLTPKISTSHELRAQDVTRAVAMPQSAAKKFPGLKVRTSNSGNNGFTSRTFSGNFSKPFFRQPSSVGERARAINLRGSVSWSQDQVLTAGMYSLSLDGSNTIELLGEGVKAVYGGAEIGDKYYAVNGMIYMGMYFFDGYVYNAETWERESVTNYLSTDMIAQCTSTDPTDGTVYGCFYDENGENLEFGTVDYTTWTRTSTISSIDIYNSWSAIAFDAEGKMYVLKLDGDLFCGDKTTGELTLIGSTGLKPQYITGGTIDPASGRFFYSYNTDDESALYEIDLTTAEATKLYDFEAFAQVSCLYVPAPEAADDAPDAVSNLEAIFEKGSLAGEIKFETPSTLFDGSEATGPLTYAILANDETLATGETEFGTVVTVPVTLDMSGTYQFIVTVSNGVGNSPKSKITMYVGDDVPVMTEVTLSYADGNMNLSWDKVTEALYDGYFVAEDVTYTVTAFPGGDIVAENISDNFFSQAVSTPDNFTVYYYEVTANFNTAKSIPVKSNSIALGVIVPPFFDDFEEDESITGFTIIDSNDDSNTWYLAGGRVTYRYSMNPGDDWFITPPVKMEKGMMYNFNIQAKCNGYPEKMEIKWGKGNRAEDMTNTLVKETAVTETSLMPFGGYIIPEEDGEYYIGIHALSDPDMYYLFIEDLSIAEGQSILSPAAVSDLKATPNYYGENNAVISFVTPTVATNDTELSSLTKVVVMREDEEIFTFDSPAIGTTLSYTDNVEESGVYKYTVVPYNEHGMGLAATVETYIGIPVPSYPTNITITEDTPCVVTISWDAPAYDSYGNPLNPDLLTYRVFDCINMTFLAEGLTETHYTYTAVEEGTQDFLYYAIYAATATGDSYNVSQLVAVGTPYSFPFIETFADGNLTYPVASGDQVYNGGWGAATDTSFAGIPSVNGDNGFIYMYGPYIDSAASLWTGKISLEGASNPAFGFYVYKFGEENDNIFSAYVQEIGHEWNKLGEFQIQDLPGDGWNYVFYDLSDYKDKVISVKINGVVKKYNYILVDDLSVDNMANFNLAMTNITAPDKVTPDTEFTVTAKVANYGKELAENYEVIIYHNGKELASFNGEPLASGNSVEFSISQTLTPASADVNEYYAEVRYAEDENADDNISQTVTTLLMLPGYPTATNLEGYKNDSQVYLTWEAPDMSGVPTESVTESFEEGESGSDEFGDWLFVDVDQSPIGGIQNIELPSHIGGETLSSFWIFDIQDGSFNETFAAHSGDKCLMAMYRMDGGQVSDWAISPELYGGAQTISFFAKSYNATYPEKIEVLYSVDGTDVDKFTNVGMEAVTLSGEWTEYKVDLPNGAKYFAIHSCAVDSYMLMIDDVTYCPKDGKKIDMTLTGYNVYRNGVKLNSTIVEETSYTDMEPIDEGTYVVTVVYNLGESAPSNAVKVSGTVGIENNSDSSVVIKSEGHNIVIMNIDGMPFSIYSVDGILINTGEGSAYTSVEVEPGVYVVNAAQKAVKVIVR